jgi:flagellar hook-associated protein 2
VATSSTGIKFSGLASGFDTDLIIEKSLEVERAPISALQSRQAQVTQQQAAWRSINTRLLALGTASKDLQESSVYESRQAVSNTPEVLTASIGSGQGVGSYSFSVESLAQNHQMVSQGFATSDAAVGTGTIQIKVGAASFPAIAVGAGQGTLSGIRDAINNANVGVSASLMDAGETAGNNRYRLVLNSNSSGKAGEVTATFSLTGGTAPAMTDLVAAQDAHVKFGQGASAIDLYSSTNLVSGAVSGLSLNLNQAKPGQIVNVKVSANSSPLRTKVENFIEQYNSLSDVFNANNARDSETGSTGVLFGDSAMLFLQDQVFDRVNQSRATGGALNSLTSLGISLDDKGKLSISDNSKFESALKDPASVKKLFGDETSGISVRLNTLVERTTGAATGSISLEDKRLTSEYESLGASIVRFEEKASRTEARLREIYLNLETTMSELKSQSSALAATLTSFVTSSSSKASGG